MPTLLQSIAAIAQRCGGPSEREHAKDMTIAAPTQA